MSRVRMEYLKGAINNLYFALSGKLGKVIAEFVADAPRQFRVEALVFYSKVLRVRTGQLRNSIAEVARQEGGKWIVGLKSNKEYAHVQHYGFNGTVAVRAHTRRNPHGATATFVEMINVRAHQRQMNIKPKYFLEIPIRKRWEKIQTQILKKIGFDR